MVTIVVQKRDCRASLAMTIELVNRGLRIKERRAKLQLCERHIGTEALSYNYKTHTKTKR
jgi:hypothetical protein